MSTTVPINIVPYIDLNHAAGSAQILYVMQSALSCKITLVLQG